jgi:hypothetical protein
MAEVKQPVEMTTVPGLGECYIVKLEHKKSTLMFKIGD